MHIVLLLGVLYTVQGTGMDACGYRVEINSSTQFIQKLLQVDDLPLQNDCYVLELQEDIELTLSVPINISNSMVLYGNGATVKCNFLSNTFNYSALIDVRNVSYFEISNITFVECPSSLRFHDVTTIMILDSHFRYVCVFGLCIQIHFTQIHLNYNGSRNMKPLKNGGKNLRNCLPL